MILPDLDHQVGLAESFLARRLYQQAVETLREVLSLDPDHPKAHALLALALLGLHRRRAADHEAVRALTCDPDCFEANFASAKVSVEQGRLDEAQQYLTWCLDHRDGHGPSLALVGELRLLQGRPAEAKSAFEEALERDPSDASTIVQLGLLALDTDDVPQATARAEAALALRPDDPDALVLMGRLLLRQGSRVEARQLAIRALRADVGHRPGLELMSQIKAEDNVVSGLWWRINGWLGPAGGLRSIFVLAVVHLTFVVARLVLTDLGWSDARALLDALWVAFIVFCWAGPAWFQRAFDAELGQVKLRTER